ncbi:hypothetical protein [Winogradskyella pacifica]|uniref:Uncharacterized protein n=1 Tax=Winogradskyella pacifica TaxID=664642 RepID=A0A3D9N468_9FLAO|nr:hypothetical protein [Winogradskyella pacifica]REE24851.1 hypothetical protein DFQ09_103157 [Winogradskyella pacifica]
MNHSDQNISDFEFTLFLEIEGNIVANRHELSIGGLTMIKNDKTYVIDFNQSYTTYIEDSDTTIIECHSPQQHFETLKDGTRYHEDFPDCKFDLPVTELPNADNVLWLDGELEAEIKRMTLKGQLNDTYSFSSKVIEWSDYES